MFTGIAKIKSDKVICLIAIFLPTKQQKQQRNTVAFVVNLPVISRVVYIIYGFSVTDKGRMIVVVLAEIFIFNP